MSSILHTRSGTRSNPHPQREKATPQPGFGTDFRHAVEFSRNEHTPPRPCRPIRGNSPKLADPHHHRQPAKADTVNLGTQSPGPHKSRAPAPRTGWRSVPLVQNRSYVPHAPTSNHTTPHAHDTDILRPSGGQQAHSLRTRSRGTGTPGRVRWHHPPVATA